MHATLRLRRQERYSDLQPDAVKARATRLSVPQSFRRQRLHQIPYQLVRR
jgi:hypothetical protein